MVNIPWFIGFSMVIDGLSHDFLGLFQGFHPSIRYAVKSGAPSGPLLSGHAGQNRPGIALLMRKSWKWPAKEPAGVIHIFIPICIYIYICIHCILHILHVNKLPAWVSNGPQFIDGYFMENPKKVLMRTGGSPMTQETSMSSISYM